MIRLTLTLNKNILESLSRSIFDSERLDLSLVYFRVADFFYVFPFNSHSLSLTEENGFLNKVLCKIQLVKDELEELLNPISDNNNLPLTWEIKATPLLKYKDKFTTQNDFTNMGDFLETLHSSSQFIINTDSGLNLPKKEFRIKPEFLYSDETHFYKTNYKDLIKKTDNAQARTLLWLGSNNSAKIHSTRIGCVGAGGLMNPFVIEAMHHGFKDFILIDPDKLEEHNLNRFYGGNREDKGKFKTEILKRILTEFNPSIAVETSNSFFPEENTEKLLSTCDIIVSGVDNDYTRVNVQLLATTLNKPLLDMGSAIFLKNNTYLCPEVDERGGQIRLSIPEKGCLACMGLQLNAVRDFKREEMDRIRGYIVGTDLTPPSIITLNSTIASIALKLLVDYIADTGISTRHIKYNEKDFKLFKVLTNRKNDCPLCG